MSTWEIIETRDNGLEVRKDRRSVSTGLTEPSAMELVKRSRQPDEVVTLVEIDGYRTPITRQFERRGWRKPRRIH